MQTTIVINGNYGYVMNIEAKRTLNGKSVKEARDQLENTKKMITKYFGSHLNGKWKFYSAVYCEKVGPYKKLCKECDLNFVFSGPKDLVEKMDKLHSELVK